MPTNNHNFERINNITNRISIDSDSKNVNINSPEILVNTLKDAINDTNKQYRILRREFIDEVKKKTESQQLLQKCIEDLKLESSLCSKDLHYFSKIFFHFNE
jgi:inorganic pyrophosphatase